MNDQRALAPIARLRQRQREQQALGGGLACTVLCMAQVAQEAVDGKLGTDRGQHGAVVENKGSGKQIGNFVLQSLEGQRQAEILSERLAQLQARLYLPRR